MHGEMMKKGEKIHSLVLTKTKQQLSGTNREVNHHIIVSSPFWVCTCCLYIQMLVE